MEKLEVSLGMTSIPVKKEDATMHLFSHNKSPLNHGTWGIMYHMVQVGTAGKTPSQLKHEVYFIVIWRNATSAVAVDSVYFDFEHAGSTKSFKVLGKGSFPDNLQGGKITHGFSPGAIKADGIIKKPGATFTLRLLLRPTPQQSAPQPPPPTTSKDQARQAFASQQRRSGNDLRLYFPNTRHRIWTSLAHLRSISPTINSMFPAESTLLRLPSIRPVDFPLPTFNDSDYEAASVGQSEADVRWKYSHGSFTQINIYEFDHTTFSSLLCWSRSGYIAFAPLLSSFRTSPQNTSWSSARWNRRQQLSDGSGLPMKVSSKSVYRLARHLQVWDLAELALAEYKNRLTVANSAEELVGHAAVRYYGIGDPTVKYIVDNWRRVKETDGMKDVQKRAERNELNGGGKNLLAVMKAL